MTTMGKLAALCPASIMLTWCGLLGAAVYFHNPLYLIGLLAAIYLLPVFLYRIHALFAPVNPGMSRISDPKYSPWWGAHQLQLVYIAIPALESVLMCVPGFYSAWLRLWGSRIGRGVHWTPTVRVADRGLLDIGDHVVIGHRVEIYAHVIKGKNDRMVLFVRPVKVGDSAFIGAGSVLGPGSEVEDHAQLPIRTEVYPNQRFAAAQTLDQ